MKKSKLWLRMIFRCYNADGDVVSRFTHEVPYDWCNKLGDDMTLIKNKVMNSLEFIQFFPCVTFSVDTFIDESNLHPVTIFEGTFARVTVYDKAHGIKFEEKTAEFIDALQTKLDNYISEQQWEDEEKLVA